MKEKKHSKRILNDYQIYNVNIIIQLAFIKTIMLCIIVRMALVYVGERLLATINKN